MRWRLGFVHAFLSLLISASGCVRRYEEPPLSEPHALVKFRVIHHEPLPRTELSEAVRLNGYDIRLPEGLPTEPRLRSVRVRPLPAEYRFATEYFHTYTTMRTEYRTETYSCGSGPYTQTCTRTVPVQVTENHHVTDAACETRIEHTPLAGAVYLVQYDFHGAGVCTASCYRQLVVPGERDFRLVPCGPTEPPVEETAGAESVLPTHVPTSPAPSSTGEEIPPPPWYRSAPSESGPTPTEPRSESGRGLSPPER